MIKYGGNEMDEFQPHAKKKKHNFDLSKYQLPMP